MNEDGHSDAMDRWKIIESEKRMTQAQNRLRIIRMWTFQDAREFVMSGVWQEEKANMFLNAIDLAEQRAIAETGPPSPYLAIKDFEKQLRLAVMTSFHVVDHAGGITGLGSMVFEPNNGHRSWRIYNPSILTANYQEKGNFGRINGVPGSGKTNLGCVIAERWASEKDHIALGNIRMLKPDDRFIYTKDAKSFFIAIANLPYESTWLFTLDEGGLVYSKPDQATRRVKDLDKFGRVVRKMGGSFNLIEQREDSVPNLIMEFAKNIFFCESKGIVSIEMRGPQLAFRDTIKDFPKTSLPFDTDDIAMFDINIDVQEIFSAISGSDDPKKSLREYITNIHALDEPRKCAIPDCLNTFVDDDKRRKYCDDHRRYYTGGKARIYSVKEEEEKKKSLEEFLK